MSNGKYKGELLDNGRFEERGCPVCGKNFIPTHQWVYKTPIGLDPNAKAVCSYTCLVKAKRERTELMEKRAGERRKKRASERREEGEQKVDRRGCGAFRRRVICLDTGIIYESVAKAAIETGCSTSGITDVCQGKRERTKKHRFKYYEGEA